MPLRRLFLKPLGGSRCITGRMSCLVGWPGFEPDSGLRICAPTFHVVTSLRGSPSPVLLLVQAIPIYIGLARRDALTLKVRILNYQVSTSCDQSTDEHDQDYERPQPEQISFSVHPTPFSMSLNSALTSRALAPRHVLAFARK